jgi:hypothetical protein
MQAPPCDGRTPIDPPDEGMLPPVAPHLTTTWPHLAQMGAHRPDDVSDRVRTVVGYPSSRVSRCHPMMGSSGSDRRTKPFANGMT